MTLRWRDDSRIWLCLGFLAVTVAVVIAYQNPAAGYELSIYSQTPIAYWISISAALLLSAVLVFSRLAGPAQSGGIALGLLSMTTIVATPIIRGYHYFGTSDSLSHLGTARDIQAGVMDPMTNRYPVVHTLGSLFSDVTGAELHHALFVLVVVFIVSFFIFVPLVVQKLTQDSRLAYVGLYASFLLLPLNHLSPSTYIHPTSQAVVYAPVLIYLFIAVYREPVRSYSILFLLVSTMFVMLHPQQAANLVVFFATVALLQLIHIKTNRSKITYRQKVVYPSVFAFALVFWLWVQNIDTFWSSVANTVVVPFTDTEVASTTASRSVSLEQVGGSLPEVFVKLFSVQLLFAVFTAVLVAGVILRATEFPILRSVQDALTTDRASEQLLLLYVIGGFIAVSSIFLVYIVGGISDQYFRHLGMMMVFGTILGAIAVGRATEYLGRRFSAKGARRGIQLLFIIVLVASMPIVFASPYFYYPTDHVTEAQMSGYETTFTNQNTNVPFDEVRSDTSRFGNAIQGRTISEDEYYSDEGGDGIPDHFADQALREHYDQRMYVPVTDADRIRDPVLWQGFRFSHDDFRYLDSEPGINKVQSNGGYDLYLVEPAPGVPTTSGPGEIQ